LPGVIRVGVGHVDEPIKGAGAGTRTPYRSLLVVGIAAIFGLVAHSLYFYPFLADDALISLRYAQRFLAGQGLTWTDGPRVEGYSNFLWVVLNAALGAIGLDLIVAARLMGLLASVVVVLAAIYGSARFASRPVWPALAGSLVWAASAPAAAWTMAGLEMPLVAACLALAVVWSLALDSSALVSTRSAVRLGLCLGALSLTRPDAILLAGTIALWVLAGRACARRPLRGAVLIAAIPALMIVAQVAFRRSYYGEWLPNTAYVKINPSLKTWTNGLAYVWRGLGALQPVAALGLAAIAWLCVAPRGERSRAHGLLLASLLVTWLAYLTVIGGDLFAGWRMMVPAIVVLALALLLGLDRLLATWRRRRWIAVAAVASLASFLFLQFHDDQNVAAKKETWEWRNKPIGELLKRGFGAQQPLLAVTGAGSIPYWSELPCLDMLGLNDRHIARVRVADPGVGWVGHEKGDVLYVLGRKPDLIHFGSPGGYPAYAYEKGMPEARDFREQYQRCHYGVQTPAELIVARIWTRRQSPKIGIQHDANRIYVPPYLLNLRDNTVTMLDPQGRFYVDATKNEPVGIARLHLDSGRWRVAEPSPGVRIVVRDAGLGTVLGGSVPADEFDVPRSGLYDLALLPSGAMGETVRVYALRLERHASPPPEVAR
jgi:hypothetical protein